MAKDRVSDNRLPDPRVVEAWFALPGATGHVAGCECWKCEAIRKTWALAELRGTDRDGSKQAAYRAGQRAEHGAVEGGGESRGGDEKRVRPPRVVGEDQVGGEFD